MKEILRRIIREVLNEIRPDNAVKSKLRELNIQNEVILVAIGKAAWRMAKGAKDELGEKIKKGIVITKYNHSEGMIDGIEIYEAGHPTPDENTIKATKRVLEITSNLSRNDTVLFLISGGGSSLFEMPKNGITLEEVQKLTDELLKSGANIVEINTVRKHLSNVKGGRFALHVSPAKVISLVLSDVLGDRLDSIASGPAYPDFSTSQQALEIAEKYKLTLSGTIRKVLNEETPKMLSNVETYIIGSVKTACEKAFQLGKDMGYNSVILTTGLNCEAKEAGRFLASVGREVLKNNRPIEKPALVIVGGETIVHVKGNGKGGRNQELALSFAIEIDGMENIVLCSFGTDGTDGPTDAAGGIVDGRTCQRIREKGFSPEKLLENNDSYNALKLAEDILITGPTGTNVNDLILMIVDDKGGEKG
jgi:hydroxypyruvate reductase